jgi:hypothetical protein
LQGWDVVLAAALACGEAAAAMLDAIAA